SSLIELARNEGLKCVAEAFADRAYTPQGTLVSRREPGAVLHDPKRVAQRMLRLVEDGTIEAIDGSLTKIQADSICVHGDSPAAVEMARELRRVLEQANITLQPFAGDRS
ncbi:MAG: LamB/YcsF family protein, partial [Pseudomonas sp.]